MNMDSKKPHWEGRSFVRRGRIHRERGLRCQDAVFISRRNDVIAASLADGSGSTDAAAAGAAVAARTAAEVLAGSFSFLYSKDTKEIRYYLITEIRHALYNLCRERQLTLDQVHSTVVAVALDEQTGRYILAHIGDGMIVFFYGEDWEVVSAPENGISRRYTRLTSMIPLGDAVRIRKGDLGSITRICLFSDGFREIDPENGIGIFEEMMEEGREITDTSDDISTVVLTKIRPAAIY